MDSVKEITDLPVELLIKIFSYLHQFDLATRVSLVCKDWKSLAEDPSLWKKLELEYVQNTSVINQIISRCSQLKWLIIKSCQIEPSVMGTLSTCCPLLENLNFNCSLMKHGPYNAYNPLPCLHELNCCCLKSLTVSTVTFEACDSVFFSKLATRSPSLEAIKLRNCHISKDCDESFKNMLVSFHGLSTLDFTGTKTTYNLIYSFSQCVTLSSLSINLSLCEDVSDDAFIYILIHCRKLKEICIDFVYSNGNIIKQIFHNLSESLESVNLSGYRLFDDDFIYIDKCLLFKKIVISYGSSLNGNFLHLIEGLPNLRHLELTFCSILKASVLENTFRNGNFSTLKFLNLCASRFLDDSCLDAIADSCSQLEHLDVTRCPKLTDEGMHHVIRKCSNLRILKLDGSLLEGSCRCMDDLEKRYLKDIRELHLGLNCSYSLSIRLNALKRLRPELNIILL